jgi:hypothetical protein
MSAYRKPFPRTRRGALPLRTPGDRPAILVPTKWLAKFESNCSACNNRMEVGSSVEGVRPEGGAWRVWHDAPVCHEAARVANWYLPASLKPSINKAVREAKTMQATVEEEWLREYDETPA